MIILRYGLYKRGIKMNAKEAKEIIRDWEEGKIPEFLISFDDFERAKGYLEAFKGKK